MPANSPRVPAIPAGYPFYPGEVMALVLGGYPAGCSSRPDLTFFFNVIFRQFRLFGKFGTKCIRRKKRNPPPGGQASGWTNRIRVQKFRIYLVKTAWTFGLWCGKVCNLRSCLQFLIFSIGSTFGDEDDLILVLRS